MLLGTYTGILNNIPHHVAVFKLKVCWITEDIQYGRPQPFVGDEVYVYPHEHDTIYHPKSKTRYSRPAVRYLRFVEYREVQRCSDYY